MKQETMPKATQDSDITSMVPTYDGLKPAIRKQVESLTNAVKRVKRGVLEIAACAGISGLSIGASVSLDNAYCLIPALVLGIPVLIDGVRNYDKGTDQIASVQNYLIQGEEQK